jgi:hypothetical protein
VEPPDEVRGPTTNCGKPPGVTQPAPVDLRTELPIPLGQVPKLGLVPPRRRGSRLNLRTVYRWATAGLKGIVLPTQLVGGQRVTSREALLRFFAAVSAASALRAGTAPAAGSSQAAAAADVAAELDRLGL